MELLLRIMQVRKCQFVEFEWGRTFCNDTSVKRYLVAVLILPVLVAGLSLVQNIRLSYRRFSARLFREDYRA